jgi:hypothetical protein
LARGERSRTASHDSIRVRSREDYYLPGRSRTRPSSPRPSGPDLATDFGTRYRYTRRPGGTLSLAFLARRVAVMALTCGRCDRVWRHRLQKPRPRMGQKLSKATDVFKYTPSQALRPHLNPMWLTVGKPDRRQPAPGLCRRHLDVFVNNCAPLTKKAWLPGPTA